MAVHLRVYPESRAAADAHDSVVHVRLGDLLPLLAVAKRNNHLWLQDFMDDEVAVSADLYDVLRAFGSYLRPPA